MTTLKGLPIALCLPCVFGLEGCDTPKHWGWLYRGNGWAEANSVVAASDGSYVVAGTTTTLRTPTARIVLKKCDAGGNTLWEQRLGEADICLGHCVRQTPDGGYIVAGSAISAGDSLRHAYLAKTDGAGKLVWSRVLPWSASVEEEAKHWGPFDPDSGVFHEACCVRCTRDGGYVIVGKGPVPKARSEDDSPMPPPKEPRDHASVDVYLMKTDASGELAWSRTFGGEGFDGGYCVEHTADGGFVVAGVTESKSIASHGESDVYLIKTNERGEELWSQALGGAKEDRAYSVKELRGGGYIIAGTTYSSYSKWFDAYLIRTDAEGRELWSRKFGGPGWDVAREVLEASDGGLVFIGETAPDKDAKRSVYLVKTDAQGVEQWNQIVGPGEGRSIAVVPGGYVVVGYSFAAAFVCMVGSK